MMVSHMHFAEESDGKQLYAGDDEHRGEEHQRTVFLNYIPLRIEYFQDGQPQTDSTTTENAEHSNAAEEMQRPLQVLEQETDGNQVEEDADRPADAIVRFALLAIDVLDRN